RLSVVAVCRRKTLHLPLNPEQNICSVLGGATLRNREPPPVDRRAHPGRVWPHKREGARAARGAWQRYATTWTASGPNCRGWSRSSELRLLAGVASDYLGGAVYVDALVVGADGDRAAPEGRDAVVSV